MGILNSILEADLKSARRFSATVSQYVNGGLAIILGLLHYTGTQAAITSVFIAALFFWYRTVLTRLSVVMDKNTLRDVSG
jgi:hypothetical protein